jgi:hypothetical protein
MTYGPTEQRPVQNQWEQPSFSEPEQQAPVWGEVIVPGEARLVVAPPTPQEELLRTVRRFLFPIALVLAIVTGDFLPILVLALIANAVLKRQLWRARQQRLRLAPTLR